MVEFETLVNLIRIGWARENSVFRRVFTNLFIPAATEEQVRWFDDLQRMSTSTDNAVRMWVERAKVNVAPLLAQGVRHLGSDPHPTPAIATPAANARAANRVIAQASRGIILRSLALR